jgi:hypothetical protein
MVQEAGSSKRLNLARRMVGWDLALKAEDV